MPCIERPERTGPRRLPAVALWAMVVAVIAGCSGAPRAPAPSSTSSSTPARPPISAVQSATPPTVASTTPGAPATPAAPAAPPPAAAAALGPVPETPPAGSAADLGPRVMLPPAPAVRTMDEFKRQAARRMVAASPRSSYMGKPPPILFAIPIIEIEVNADGSVRSLRPTRLPANPAAAGTVDLAKEAIRRGAPYGDVSKLPRPWKWSEVFLFNEKSQFKPRTLD